MKAVVMTGPAKLEWKEMPMPEIGPDDILLQIKAAGICGGDLHFYTGAIESKYGYPLIIGHEFAGIIASRGENVDSEWQVGDRVVSDNTGQVCGRCPSCEKGNFINCPGRELLGCTYNGGFTNYVRIPGHVLQVHKNTLLHLPDSIRFPEATVLEPAANAYRAVIQEAKVHAGENVVVIGPGPLGLLSVQMAKIAGAAKIILVGASFARGIRQEIGKAYGATHWLESDSMEDIVAQIKNITGTSGVSAVFDTVGHPSVFPIAVGCVRNEGVIVRIGLNSRPLNYSLNELTERSITLIGHMGFNNESWRNCIALADAGILNLTTIITDVLPMSQFDKGIKDSLDGTKVGKVILIPDGETEERMQN